nr:phage Gp37/Gp68 family protein [Candidatus Thermoplasmatota archaeon]
MGDKSSIEWTDATWNPSTGCSKVSPGCKNCYAERLSNRLYKMRNPKFVNGFNFTIHENALMLPLKWKKPRKIFVNSMSDLFHEDMDNSFLIRCFEIMRSANWHIFQVLTKRPRRMLNFAEEFGIIPDNIWLGTSVELRSFTYRIDILRNINAKVKFISFEPLLGPLGKLDLSGISWAIVGGESGPKARKVKPEWVRDIREQAREQGVSFFFKQWGGKTPRSNGRILDGRLWDEFPKNINFETTV